MNILQVVDHIGMQYGGSAAVVRNLSQELANRGHEVTIYSSDMGIMSQLAGSKLRTFKTVLSIRDSIRITPAMLFARFKGYDIVHVHNYYTFQNLVTRLRVSKTLMVLSPQGTFVIYDELLHKVRPTFYLTDFPWRFWFLRRFNRIICTSNIELWQAKRLGLKNAILIPNGINLSDFAVLPEYGTLRKQLAISDSTKIVLYLGQLNYIKGLDLLIKAFEGFKGNEVCLVIVGNDTGYLSELVDSIRENHLGRQVVYLGPLYGRAKISALADADVCVLPSRYDVFGITVLEALACGTPVVVTDRCGVKDYINHRLGEVVPFDEHELFKAIHGLLYCDRPEDMHFRREWVKQFSWQVVAEKMEGVYLDITSDNNDL